MDAETAADPVGLYMREINRVELKTAAKEQALASDIELVSQLEGLELELVGGLGYDYGEDARAAGAPSTVLWEKAMVLLTPHRRRRTGGPGRGPSPGVGRRPHAGRGVSTSGVQGRHRPSDQPRVGGTGCQGSGHYRGRRPRVHRYVVPGQPGTAGGGNHRRGDRENHRGRWKNLPAKSCSVSCKPVDLINSLVAATTVVAAYDLQASHKARKELPCGVRFAATT